MLAWGMAPARRFALLVSVVFLLAVTLVACSAPAASVTPSNVNTNGGVNQFRTPVPPTPPPTFPPFTMGAWPSNYSPGNNDTITIYVLCRIQDTTMQNPPQPAPNVAVHVTFDTGQSGQGTTDASGLAAVQFTINDPSSGLPVNVTISANFGGQPYTAQTFFTPSPLAQPTATANPNATPTTPGGTPSTTATPKH